MWTSLTNYLPADIIQDLDFASDSDCQHPSLQEDNPDLSFDLSVTSEHHLEQSKSFSSLSIGSEKTKTSTIEHSPLFNKHFSTWFKLFSDLKKQKLSLELQKLISHLNENEISLLFQLWTGHFVKLSKDPNGNYFLSDLLKYLNDTQRMVVLNEFLPVLTRIALDRYGTHPWQVLVEKCRTMKEVSLILDAVSKEQWLSQLCLNENGTYVIQKIWSSFPLILKGNELKTLDPIYSFAVRNVVKLSLNMNGVCVIKQIITLYENTPNYWYMIIFQISKNFLEICWDQYGNYAIQLIMSKLWDNQITTYIKNWIYYYFVQLASNRCSSHIAEWFLTKLDYVSRRFFIESMLKTGKLNSLSNSKYGVYVLNKIWTFYSSKERDYLILTWKEQNWTEEVKAA